MKKLETILAKNKAFGTDTLIMSKFLGESERRKEKLKKISKLQKDTEKADNKFYKSFVKNLFTRKKGAAYSKGLSIVENAFDKGRDELVDRLDESRETEIPNKRIAFERGYDLFRLAKIRQRGGYKAKYQSRIPTLSWTMAHNILIVTKQILEDIEYAPITKNIQLDEVVENNQRVSRSKIGKLYERMERQRKERKKIEKDSNMLNNLKQVGDVFKFTVEELRVHELSIFTFSKDLENVKNEKELEDHILIEPYFNKIEDAIYEIEYPELDNTISFRLKKKPSKYELEFKDADENLELNMQLKMLHTNLTKGYLLSTYIYDRIPYSDMVKRTAMATPKELIKKGFFQYKKGYFDLFFEEEKVKLVPLLEKIRLVTGKGEHTYEKYRQRILDVNNKLNKDYMWFINNKQENAPNKKSKRFKSIFDWIFIISVFYLIKLFISNLHIFGLKLPQVLNPYAYIKFIRISIEQKILNKSTTSKISDIEILNKTLNYPKVEKILNLERYDSIFINILMESWKSLQISENIKDIIIIYYTKKAPVFGEEFWDIVNQIGLYGFNLFDNFF